MLTLNNVEGALLSLEKNPTELSRVWGYLEAYLHSEGILNPSDLSTYDNLCKDIEVEKFFSNTKTKRSSRRENYREMVIRVCKEMVAERKDFTKRGVVLSKKINL